MFAAIYDLGVGLTQWRTSYKLSLQDIELRYKRSLLGPFWISAALVATILALAFVFSGVFQTNFASYIGYIGTGLLTWQLILALTTEACASVIEHAPFLQNVRMPMTVIAGRIAFRNAIVFMHNGVAVVGLLLLFGVQMTPNIIWAAPGAVLILVFGYFLSMMLGPICTRFRDVPLVVQSAMQVIFFLTPIFWMPVEGSHHPGFILANPFYHMIQLVRAPMLGTAPDPLNWQVALWCCAGTAVLAVISVSMTRKRMALWL